jgi:hypothetical protein
MALLLEENYRQAGRSIPRGSIVHARTAGQLNRTHALTAAGTGATIPSKYETVLFGAAKAREGFGSQASRFAAELVNDNPGPGTYSTLGSTVIRDAPSIGKRGYGNGFASRTKRGGLPGSAPARTGPGPGNYDVQNYKATGTDARTVSRPFAPMKGGRALRPDGAVAETPGPGTYNLGRHMDVHARDEGYSAPTIAGRLDPGDGHGGHRSVFASKAPRFCERSASDVRPGPGAYDPAKAIALREATKNAVPSAAFRSGLSRTSPRNAAARAPAKEDALGLGRSAVTLSAAGTVTSQPPSSTSITTPGPGHYAPVHIGQVYARNAALGPSPAFREGLAVRALLLLLRRGALRCEGLPRAWLAVVLAGWAVCIGCCTSDSVLCLCGPV